MIHPQPGLASVPASLSLPHPAQGHLTSAASTDRVRDALKFCISYLRSYDSSPAGFGQRASKPVASSPRARSPYERRVNGSSARTRNCPKTLLVMVVNLID